MTTNVLESFLEALIAKALVPFQSPSIGELTKALVALQSDVQPVFKSCTNDEFDSSFAAYEDVWNVIGVPLSAHGLAISHTDCIVNGQAALQTTLMHVSGEWKMGTQLLKVKGEGPQAQASAHTYAKRYSLIGILGLRQTNKRDDDDGEAAEGRAGKSGAMKKNGSGAAAVGPKPTAVNAKPAEKPSKPAIAAVSALVIEPPEQDAEALLESDAPDEKLKSFLLVIGKLEEGNPKPSPTLGKDLLAFAGEYGWSGTEANDYLMSEHDIKKSTMAEKFTWDAIRVAAVHYAANPKQVKVS